MSTTSDLMLKWGIVGAGLISNDFCVAMSTLDKNQHCLKAVSDRFENVAKEFAERFQIPDYFDSYDDLINSVEVNIVYVGVVNSLHKDVCLKAIRAGKHVLCEKPMSCNRDEQNEVLDAAKAKGVFFMEALWTRFLPIVTKLREELSNKTIGEVKFFSASLFNPIIHVERIQKLELGGGALLDIGLYPIQMACLVFDNERPIKITASGHLMPTGVDECLTIILLYSNQRIAQINVSCSCAYFSPTVIAGDKGILQIPNYSQCPTELILPNGERYHAPFEESKMKINFLNRIGLKYEIEACRDAISQGKREHPLASHESSKLILEIIEEVKKQIGYGSLQA